MKKRWMVLLIAVVFVVAAMFYVFAPMQHVKTFVSLYSKHIEESIAAGDGIPPKLGFERSEIWEGQHTMVEFTFSATGIGSQSRYYGCYYSPEDVPLAFQNVDVPLTQDGHDYWTWTGEGDNHGSTRKLRDKWYYFEASF